MGKKEQPTYSKQQFLDSKQFTTLEKDVLRALLQEGETYAVEQVKKILQDFWEKEAE